MQKTAYELRISDWSSDVCSSDLRPGPALPRAARVPRPPRRRLRPAAVRRLLGRRAADARRAAVLPAPGGIARRYQRARPLRRLVRLPDGRHPALAARSEEHTYELQSLMRISYAVFCWKKKNQPHKTE